jgi:lysophospholipase L1-like esterase
MRSRRLLRTGCGLLATLGAFATAEHLLERYYYSRTLSYHQAADVAYWEDQHTLLLYLPHPTLFWSLKPGIRLRATEDADPQTLRPERRRWHRLEWEVQVGPKGFRGPDFPTEKAPGELRVACLGDSRTLGEGLAEHETFPAGLQRRLREAVGKAPRVLNLGHDGWSSYQGLALLKSRVIGYAPDVAVFAFGINDVDTDWGLSDRERAEKVSRPFVNVQRTLYRSMTFYFAQRQFLWAKGRLFGKTRLQGGQSPGDAGAVPRVSPPEYDANLREFARLCHARGIVPVLLVVPPNPYRDWSGFVPSRDTGAVRPASLGEQQLEGPRNYARARELQARGDFEGAHVQFASGLEATVFAELNRIAARVAREEDALLVDVTSTFLQVAPHDSLYIDEVHANPRGAALIAGALAEAIVHRVRDVRIAAAPPAVPPPSSVLGPVL